MWEISRGLFKPCEISYTNQLCLKILFLSESFVSCLCGADQRSSPRVRNPTFWTLPHPFSLGKIRSGSFYHLQFLQVLENSIGALLVEFTLFLQLALSRRDQILAKGNQLRAYPCSVALVYSRWVHLRWLVKAFTDSVFPSTQEHFTASCLFGITSLCLQSCAHREVLHRCLMPELWFL
jgi:hypothetical protein